MGILDDRAGADGAHSVDFHFDDAVEREAVQRRYREDFARFAKRRRIAFLVRVATTVLAVGLIAMGVALVASSFTTIANEYLATRHVPGADGSISIATDGSYALAQTEGGELPSCSVVDADTGLPLDLEPWTLEGDPPLRTWRFDATTGRYQVTCEGGNDGMVAYAADSVPMLQHGYLGIVLQALPFLLIGVGLFWGGKFAARRICPESMRPMIPS